MEIKDTSPAFGRAPRHLKVVSIKQENQYLKSFDAEAIYPSDQLPEWFTGLQSVIEDDGFKSMQIVLGNQDGTGGTVTYQITAKQAQEG